MAKNGNGEQIGRILGLLEDLPSIKRDIGEIKTDIATLCQQEKSTQCELTDYKTNNPIQKELDKHVNNHWLWITLLFGSGVLFVIGMAILK